MLNKLKEYLADVTKGYRNTLMNEELEWVLRRSVAEIERLTEKNNDLELELLYLKRDIGWTNK